MELMNVVGILLAIIGLIGGFGYFRLYRALSHHANCAGRIRTIHTHFIIAKVGVILGILLAVPAAFKGGWFYGDFACSMYGFEGFVSGLAGMGLIALISIERYYATVKYDKKSLATEPILCVIWLVGLFWSILPLFRLAGQYELETNKLTCTLNLVPQSNNDRLYLSGLVIMGFGVPTLIAFLFQLLTWKSSGKISRFDAAFNKICRHLLMVELISWSPYVLLAVAGLVPSLYHLTQNVLLSHAAPLVAKAGAAYMPYLYKGF